MAIFRSRWIQAAALLLIVILLFSASWCYVYANDNAGMSEIFTYTDFRNTESYSSRLSNATGELVSLARDVYAGKKVTAVDIPQGGALDGAFHYYFYADGVVLTDIPLLDGMDFSHAKALAVYNNDLCYLLDTSHTQADHYSVVGDYSWEPYDLTKTVSLSVFSCDAGAILIPDSDWINEQYSVWATAKNRALLFIVLLSAAVLPMVYLVLSASWAKKSEKSSRLPGFFTELIVLAALLSVTWIIQFLDISYLHWLQGFFALFGRDETVFVYVAFSALFTAVVLLLLVSVLGLIRSAKNSRLLRGSFVWWVCHKPFQAFRKRIDGHFFRRYRFSVVYTLRTVIFLVAEALLIACFVATAVNHYWVVLQGILLFIIATLTIVYVYSNYYDFRALNRLLDHITELQDGNLSYRADIPEQTAFSQYESQLRSVGDGFDQTLRSQVAAERSRVDLITNVSHDLRTPLTSIIGYLDLLSKVELSPEARDYVRILTEKSNRLNHLVSDVFVLSKANSGAEDVPMEDLDLFLLARQLVADLSDSAASAGKTVRLIGEGAAPIRSNGNKIYRILQNMLDNALKYSLSGTRIFVVLSFADGNASVTVKNTSSYEMNFSADEIAEQFVRGDPSRTGEGSGLGLAIAKRFAEQLGAEFRISIDGDQFSSSITFSVKPSENDPSD